GREPAEAGHVLAPKRRPGPAVDDRHAGGAHLRLALWFREALGAADEPVIDTVAAEVAEVDVAEEPHALAGLRGRGRRKGRGEGEREGERSESPRAHGGPAGSWICGFSGWAR